MADWTLTPAGLVRHPPITPALRRSPHLSVHAKSCRPWVVKPRTHASATGSVLVVSGVVLIVYAPLVLPRIEKRAGARAMFVGAIGFCASPTCCCMYRLPALYLTHPCLPMRAHHTADVPVCIITPIVHEFVTHPTVLWITLITM